MRNGTGHQRDQQYNLGLPSELVFFLLFLKHFLDRSFPKFDLIEFFAKANQQQQHQKLSRFLKRTQYP